MADFANLRADFPALAGGITYLDSAATTQKPAVMIEAMDRFYRERYAPIGRGLYTSAAAATKEYEAARQTVASFIGAVEPSEVVFTGNSTEAINLVALAWGRKNLKRGDALLLTEMEHHSNLVPWQLLAKEQGLELRYAKITATGQLDLADFKEKSAGAKLVAVTHASNVLGTINPIAELAELAHEAGAKILVDGAQAVPQLPVSVRELGADWYVFSGHKCYGPTGIGVLWTRRALYEEMDPVFGGGGTVKEVTFAETDFADPPPKFEAGSPASAEAVGLAAALEYLSGLGMERVREHAMFLAAPALEKLGSVEGVKVLGPPDPKDRVGLVAFTLEGVPSGDLAASLDHDGVAIRSGRHCTYPLHKTLGIESSARASFGVYTTADDIDRLHEVLLAAKQTLV
ncbi:MAG: cysteine desulfurase [bacterium]|nr:cysteine desulfurase [bacterium]MDZ4248162.1 cysteine desulfurase [Patescibacteria group bacterium]